MTLGLGTGSTTAIFIDLLGRRLGEGALKDIRGVATSQDAAAHARRVGIPLLNPAEMRQLDLAVDGADEVDDALDLIKGLGKALLREKIVAIHARRFLIVVDASKRTPQLGLHRPLPVEITQFAAAATVRWLDSLGCRAELWLDDGGEPLCTDNGNYLARCWFEGGIADAQALARSLADRPGVVEHGLFLDMASAVIVAGSDGIHLMER